MTEMLKRKKFKWLLEQSFFNPSSRSCLTEFWAMISVKPPPPPDRSVMFQITNLVKTTKIDQCTVQVEVGSSTVYTRLPLQGKRRSWCLSLAFIGQEVKTLKPGQVWLFFCFFPATHTFILKGDLEKPINQTHAPQYLERTNTCTGSARESPWQSSEPRIFLLQGYSSTTCETEPFKKNWLNFLQQNDGNMPITSLWEIFTFITVESFNRIRCENKKALKMKRDKIKTNAK